MKDVIETKSNIYGWLTSASIVETKKHVAQASTVTLMKALRSVSDCKGKSEAIRRELFKRLEVDDVVKIPTGKVCLVKEHRGKYVYLKEACGQWTWKDLDITAVMF